MTSTYRISLCVAAVIACLGPGRALAADAGRSDAGTPPVTRDAGAAGDAGPKVVTIDDSPLACNGALCDTTTGATLCSIAGVGRASEALSISGALCAAAAAVTAFSRRARRAGEPRR